MGYELNKLMKQFGVATPGAVAYTGAPAPGEAPTPPTLAEPVMANGVITKALSKAQIASNKEATDKYNADKAAFDEAVRKYGLSQKEYNQYRDAYQGRIAATPMYTDQQYYTGPSAGMTYATGSNGIGADKYNQNINNWLKQFPNATPQQTRAAMDQYGISGYDVAQARGTPGSMWGDTTVAAPTYGAVPITLAGKTGQEKADYYRRLRDIGYTDPDIRFSAEKTFGKQTDTDWNALKGLAYNLGEDPGARFGPRVIDGKTALGTTNGTETINLGGNDQVGPPAAGTVGSGEMRTADVDAWGRSRWNDDFGKPPYSTETIPFSHGGPVHDMAQKYNVGGAVRRFQFGGNEGQPEDPIETIIRERGGVPGTTSPVAPQTEMRATNLPPAQPVTASPAAQPVQAPPAATTPVSPAATDLMGMLNKYLGQESVYAPELKAARTRSDAENKAFQDMIAAAMKSEGAKPDKSEMYFRLAAAFGSPSKTGRFTENLALAGKEMGEYAKDVRTAQKAEQQMKLQLGLEAQKIKAQAAREELGTLRQLTAEEMKDKRAILQEYIKSGLPQSEAGKAAADAGLTRGTPEFTAFVNKYIEDKIATGNMLKEAMVLIAAGQLELGRTKERRAEESGKKLTPAEVKLKSEAETTIGGLDDSMASLKRAYSLNPNTFDGTLASIAQRKLLEQTDPKDPRVLATREQANLLSKGAIDKLRASFGGNPTEGERAALLQLEGLDSKSKEERAMIMKNTYKLLQARRAREQKRLNDISAGLYRETTPSAGEIE